MSDFLDHKGIGLVALGVVALFSAYQVFQVTKKLDQQQQAIV